MKFGKSQSRRIGTTALAVIVSCGAFLADGSSGSAAVRTGPAREMIVMLRNQNSSVAIHSAARRAAIKTEQASIIRSLRASGATHITSLTLLNAVIAKMTPAEAAKLATNRAVASVLKNSTIPAPSLSAKLPAVTSSKVAHAITSKVPNSLLCGTAKNPQLNPEALTNINATPAQLGSNDGAGVTVATIADGLDPTDPDFQRNAAYGTPGQPVVTQYDFSGDPAGTPTGGEEMFGDASSIASQGNAVYDLSTYVSSAHPLPAGCDIKIVGDAPGSSVEALKVFPDANDTTESAFLEAINFAVTSGAKVINESFGSNNFPDTSLDVTRDADDAAVAAGVTVVVSSGDAGITSTIGSPATDPNVISVGASTTFRGYLQFTDGGINAPGASGAYIDNNISSLSSGGYTQSGNTVDIVAPGDLNWALCGVNASLFTDCTNESGNGTAFDLFGGTSEAAPLTAGAAADVISAYASTHHGQDPSPALVKQILMSTATDIGAPASEQGAGLLNVLAAVKEAKSIQSGFGFGNNSNSSGGGLLLNPGQINVVQGPGQTSNQTVQVTNTGNSPVNVNLSTRALNASPVHSQSGTFCMQPATPTPSCPANSGVFPIWSGVNEVYQEVNFNVAPTGQALSRLEFAADYQNSGQTSLLHFALLDPTGAYAAYSLPQGQGDYGEVEVTNPVPGKWTAVFFTVANADGPGDIGTSGPIQWSANTFTYGQGANIYPSTLSIGPGQTGYARLSVSSSNVAGDTSQSVVVSSPYGTTTVPVTVRTTVQTGRNGGTFAGVLTGGNGRDGGGTVAQTNSYQFTVPQGLNDVDVSIALADDPGDFFLAELVDPNGQTVGYSTNVTATDGTDSTPALGLTANLYKVNPIPGQWTIVVEWLNPVTGLELSEPFTGTIAFNGVNVSSNLPNGGFSRIASGSSQTYNVKVTNTGNAPEAYFVDPRLNQNVSISLPDVFGSATGMTLPLPGGLSFPVYLVPSQTTQLQASLTGSAPVTFDAEPFPGDPDISPGVNSRWSTYGGIHGDNASVTLSQPEITPGLWLINPAEIGPFGAAGAPSVTASANLNVQTQAFDPWITSSTGDMWSAFNGLLNQTAADFSPLYLAPGASGTITVSVSPTASPGTRVSGTLFVDDYTLGTAFLNGFYESDELAAIPYSYTVSH
jgi:hypothetical protein